MFWTIAIVYRPVGSSWGFPSGSVIENPPANAGDIRDAGSVLGLGRFPAGGHGNPLQYSCLEKPMDRAACRLQSRGLQESDMTGSDLAITRAWEVLGQGDEIEKEKGGHSLTIVLPYLWSHQVSSTSGLLDKGLGRKDHQSRWLSRLLP